MSDVADRVKKIVVEHLGVEAEKVQDNANFIDDLGADSLDTVELVLAFEEEVNVEIPDDAGARGARCPRAPGDGGLAALAAAPLPTPPRAQLAANLGLSRA